MPIYDVQGPDGRTVTLEGPEPPQEHELDEIFANLPRAAAPSGVPTLDTTKRWGDGLVGNEEPNAIPSRLSTPMDYVGGLVSAIGNRIAAPFRPKNVAVFDTTGQTKDLAQPVQPMFQTGVPISQSLGLKPFPTGDIPKDVIADTIRGIFLTPESIGTLGIGGVLAGLGKLRAAHAVPLAMFGAPMVEHTPAAIADVATKAGTFAGTPDEQMTEQIEKDVKQSSTETLVHLLMLAGVGKGTVDLLKGGGKPHGKEEKVQGQEEKVFVGPQPPTGENVTPPAEAKQQVLKRGLLHELFGGVKPTGGKAVDAAGNPIQSGEVSTPGLFDVKSKLPPIVLPNIHGHKEQEQKTVEEIIGPVAEVPPSGVPETATVPEVAAKVAESGPLPPGSPRHDLGNLVTKLKNVERGLPAHEQAEFAERLSDIWTQANLSGDFETALADARQLESVVPALMQSKETATKVEPGVPPVVEKIPGTPSVPVEKPNWVKNLESIPEANRNEAMQERLAKWNAAHGEELLTPEAEGPQLVKDFARMKLKPDAKGEYETSQVVGRLRNLLHPDEFASYETPLKSLPKKVNAKVLEQVLQENAPKVEVHAYGMEGKVSEAKKEYDKMTHEWLEQLPMALRPNINSALMRSEPLAEVLVKHYGWTKENAQQAEKYSTLAKQVGREEKDSELFGKGNTPRATSAYSTVSALPTNEPMPEWTTTKSGKNVQRVDVVIPYKAIEDKGLGKTTMQEYDASEKASKKSILWQPDNLHENLPNTLGWAMIQYKTGPKGEKIAVIAEAQSRWGQDVRESKARAKNDPYGRTPGGVPSYEERAQQIDHPLLRDYNRLILKAAIEQARKEGATHIMVSDAETAMMTEGHDATAAGMGEGGGGPGEFGNFAPGQISQAPGMRLNYDTILPKIAEELTGSNGERVSLGEHKNTYDYHAPEGAHGSIFQEQYRRQRPNLIFRNPDGTPKTDVSGRMYPISGAKEKFSLFSKDRVQTEFHTPEKESYDKLVSDLKAIPNTLENFNRKAELQKQIEAIKNKSGGMPPTEEKPYKELFSQPHPKWWEPEFEPYRAAEVKKLGVEHGADLLQSVQKIAERGADYGNDAALAGFLVRHYAKALKAAKFDTQTPMPKGLEERAMYRTGPKTVVGIQASAFAPFKAILHEAAHAATWDAFERPTTRNAMLAKATIRQLRERAILAETDATKVMSAYEKEHFDYMTKSDQEFIAGIFSSEKFRQHLNEIKIGPTTLFDKVVDAIKQILGVKDNTALSKAFDALIEGKKGQGLEFDKLPEGKGEELGAPPVPGDPLPFRYKDYGEEKTDATTARGLGKVPVLARLFDPRSYKTLPEEKVILTNQISKYKADTGVAVWLEKNKTSKRGFKVGDDGKVTLADGSRGFMSDVIEKELKQPGSQPLTREQKAFVEQWREINKAGIEYAQKNGVKFFLDENGKPRELAVDYFPRPRIGTEGLIENTKKSLGQALRPGAKQSSFKSRYHETEAEGVANKVKYEPDEYFRAAEWLKSMYRSVADARLAKDAALKGRLGIRMVPSGIYAPGGGQMTMMSVGKGPRYGEGEVFGVPALKGRVFPIETAKKLQQFFQSGAPNAVHVASWVNNAIKGIKFTMDVSAPFNQGLPMMAYKPGRWAKATAMSYAAMLDGLVRGDSTILSRYLSKPENSKAAREFVENGGSLVRLQDFLAGAEHGGLIEHVPGIRRVVRASAQSMGTFLSIAKVELYKALEPLAKGDKAALVEVVDNTVMSGRMEQVGLSQGRALVERLIFNAPSYLRAFGGLTVQAAQGGIEGKVAFRAITGLLGVVAAQMFLAYKLQGLSDEEIKERMDPRSSNFMRIAMPTSDGQKVEMGYGNVFLSFARLLGDFAEIAQGKKSLKPGTEGNPFLRWLSYRKSPIVDFVWQTMSGKDYRGMPVGFLEAAGRAVVPLPVEPKLDQAAGKLTSASANVETAGQFFGLNAFTKEKPSMNERARQQFGKELGLLTLKERMKLAMAKSKETKPSLDAQEMVSLAATKNEFDRRREVQASLPKAQQEFLTKNKLSLPSFRTGFEIAGESVPVTPEERAKHSEFIRQEYADSIAKLMASPRIEEFRKNGTLQRRLEVILTVANNRARAKFRREVRSASTAAP